MDAALSAARRKYDIARENRRKAEDIFIKLRSKKEDMINNETNTEEKVFKRLEKFVNTAEKELEDRTKELYRANKEWDDLTRAIASGSETPPSLFRQLRKVMFIF